MAGTPQYYKMNSPFRNLPAQERLIVALDVPTREAALALTKNLRGAVSWFKVGLQLYTACGPEIVRAVRAEGGKVFLDLKLHDIPNTVARTVETAAALEVEMLTFHLGGGRAMAEAALAAAPNELLLLGVTVLTSSDAATLRETGVNSEVEAQVLALARLGHAAGIRGFVASPNELIQLRPAVGDDVVLVTPGVRTAGGEPGDQKRVATPQNAIKAGANFIVVGRPIIAANDPRAAAEKIVAEIAEAL